MQIKYTQPTLARIEKILEEGKYLLRYEKGTFNSGYCVLEHKKVVVVNKFLNVEGRINTLLDILPSLKITADHLSPESAKLYRQALAEAGTGVQPDNALPDEPLANTD